MITDVILVMQWWSRNLDSYQYGKEFVPSAIDRAHAESIACNAFLNSCVEDIRNDMEPGSLIATAISYHSDEGRLIHCGPEAYNRFL